MSARQRWAIVATLFALAVPFGIHSALGDKQSLYLNLLRLGFHLLCVWWCWSDAVARGHFLGWPGRLALVIFGPVGMLFYLVWTRGWLGLAIAVLAVVVWMVISFGAYTTAGYLKYGNEWFVEMGVSQ